MTKNSPVELKTIESCFTMTVLHKCNKCKGRDSIDKECKRYIPLTIESHEMTYIEMIDLEIEQKKKDEQKKKEEIYMDYRKLSN